VHLKIRSRELWQFQVDGYIALHDFNLGVELACKNSGKFVTMMLITTLVVSVFVVVCWRLGAVRLE